MTTIEVTADNLPEQLQKGGILLLDFWANWCGPCKSFEPVYESVSARLGHRTLREAAAEHPDHAPHPSGE